jgi:hypothetical protein
MKKLIFLILLISVPLYPKKLCYWRDDVSINHVVKENGHCYHIKKYLDKPVEIRVKINCNRTCL